MPGIHITDIEAAINFWRERRPSADGFTLAPPVHALASLYARMVFQRQDLADEQAFSSDAWAAWQTWYASTPDTPCIAICSTSQGDAVCKGCGRTESEVDGAFLHGGLQLHAALGQARQCLRGLGGDAPDLQLVQPRELVLDAAPPDLGRVVKQYTITGRPCCRPWQERLVLGLADFDPQALAAGEVGQRGVRVVRVRQAPRQRPARRRRCTGLQLVRLERQRPAAPSCVRRSRSGGGPA
jgi:hypothetical protein